MTFHEGMKVEVLMKKKVPSGVWRCAEIVASNGDGYNVRYIRRPGVLCDVVEKVSAQAVRPCPPRVNVPVSWGVGDIVEVLDNGYWKTAEIQEVMEGGYYQIHLVGSIDEFRVGKSSIRTRQDWRDNSWVLLEKESGVCKGLFSRTLKKDHAQDGPEATMSKSRKRLSPDGSATRNTLDHAQKRRAIENDGFMCRDSYSFVGKVDSLAHPRKNQAKDNVLTSTKQITKINNGNHKYSGDAKCLARTLRSEDCVSTVSSVGSCSIINVSPDRLLSHSLAGCSLDSDSLCSDADSFECFGDEEGVAACQSKGEFGVRAHKTELDTYRNILESLYASGPLSWEQEASLTNLRMKLYVSNDEHLMELRRLKSIGGFGVSCC